MEKALIFDGQKVEFNPNQKLGVRNKVIITAFLKILAKIARPFLVAITAEIIKSIAADKEKAESFIRDVLVEIE